MRKLLYLVALLFCFSAHSKNITNFLQIVHLEGTNYFYVVAFSNGVPVSRTIDYADFQRNVGSNVTIAGASFLNGTMRVRPQGEWEWRVDSDSVFHLYSYSADESVLTFDQGDMIFESNPRLPNAAPNKVLLSDVNSYIRDSSISTTELNSLGGISGKAASWLDVKPGVKLLSPVSSVFTVDFSGTNGGFLYSTAISGNITVVVTNLTANSFGDISILGPAGSNYVTWVWEPWVNVCWPVDDLTAKPVTNNFIFTNCFLDISIRAYATNHVRVGGKLFR